MHRKGFFRCVIVTGGFFEPIRVPHYAPPPPPASVVVAARSSVTPDPFLVFGRYMRRPTSSAVLTTQNHLWYGKDGNQCTHSRVPCKKRIVKDEVAVKRVSLLISLVIYYPAAGREHLLLVLGFSGLCVYPPTIPIRALAT